MLKAKKALDKHRVLEVVTQTEPEFIPVFKAALFDERSLSDLRPVFGKIY